MTGYQMTGHHLCHCIGVFADAVSSYLFSPSFSGGRGSRRAATSMRVPTSRLCRSFALPADGDQKEIEKKQLCNCIGVFADAVSSCLFSFSPSGGRGSRRAATSMRVLLHGSAGRSVIDILLSRSDLACQNRVR